MVSISDLLLPENNTPSLGYVKNKLSETLILTIIKLHIIDLSDFLNLTRPMKDSQVDQTSEMIMDEFPLMKIADVIYVFKQAKMGAFGAIYEGLDGAKILSWFRQVWSDRIDYAEFSSSVEHNKNKNDIASFVGDERTSGDCRNELKNLISRSQGHFIQENYNSQNEQK